MGATLELRILGPFEARVDGGAPLPLGGLRQRSLLAILALRANEVVSTDRLVDELWGESPPRRAVHTVQVFVSRLRAVLGPAESRLITSGPGYRLELGTDELDASRCEHLYERARSALVGGRAGEARAILKEVEPLWRGDPLTEFTYEPFAQASIARLEELRASCHEEMIEAELALGRHVEVVPALEAMVREHPFRERPRGQLMLALYRCGRQAEALDVYQQARQVLVDELALDPSPALQELEQSILRQDPSLAAKPASPSAEPDSIVGVAPAEQRPASAHVSEPYIPGAPQPTRSSTSAIIRKTVTLLAVRLAVRNRVDPEVERGLISAARDEAQRIISRHGGVFVSRLGGELLGVFGLPLTREDDVWRALRAASELSERASELGSGELGGLVMQAAVDAGEVVADESGDLSGEPLNSALELVHAAQPSEVLVSHVARRLTSGSIQIEPALDGGASRLVAVGAERSTLQRGEHPMVGRKEELAAARTALDRVLQSGNVHLLTVLGDPGIGKSRLVAELAHEVDGRAIVLLGRCLSYGEGVAMWPLREALTRAAGEESRAAVRELLNGADDSDLVADVVASTLGLSPDGIAGEQIPWAFRRCLEIIARRGPVVLVIEDAHWAGAALLDLVDELIDWLVAPVLVICPARPELLEVRPTWGGGHARISSIVLGPLTDDETLELVLQRGTNLTEIDRTALLGSAEGNPLFVEQLLAMQTEDPRWGREGEIPATIQTLLAARLDRLGPGERGLIEAASVIGREFTSQAVVELLPPDARPSAGQHLRTLVRRGLIEPYRATAGGDGELRFHHMLIRDVAYRTIGKAVRGEQHERYADALIAGGEGDEFVGYHLEQAFRYRAEIWPHQQDVRAVAQRAGEHLKAAGCGALARGDANAGVKLLRRAAEMFEAAGSPRTDVLLELGTALVESGGYQEAELVLQQALEQARGADDARIVGRAMIELSYLRTFLDPSFHASELQAVARDAISVFEQIRDEAGLSRARLHLAEVHFQRGCFKSMENELTLGLEHSEHAGASRDRSRILTALATAALMGPRPVDESVSVCTSILDRAGDDLRLAAFAETMLAVLDAMAGRGREARLRWRVTKRRLEEAGLTVTVALLHMYRALIELLEPAPQEAEEIAEAYSVVERTGEQGHLATIAALRARLLYAQRRYEEADLYSRISRDASSEDDVVTQILWRGTRGKLMLRSGDGVAGEDLVRSAVAHAQGTDSLMLQADALRDRAEVFAGLNRLAPAAADLEQAASLYAAKGIERAAAAALRERESLMSGARIPAPDAIA